MGAVLFGDADYASRLVLLAVGSACSAVWIFCCRNLTPGIPRLAAALPALAANAAAPLLFRRIISLTDADSELVTVVLVEFSLTWLCSFKILAWVLGRGPLAARKEWSLLQFSAVQLAPITPLETPGPSSRAGRLHDRAGGAADLALAFLAKALLVVACLSVLRLDPPLLVSELLFTLGLYAVLSFVMDGPAALASATIGMEVSPHFDAPWLATSLADFWAKRWDLAAGNTLRHLVYEPVLEGRLVRPAGPAARATRSAAAAAARQRDRRAAGAAACFLVSGAMHELQFVYMTGRWSGGLMLAFFLAQVPLMAVERRLAAALRPRGWQVPALLRVAATLGTLLLAAHWTFWAACHRHGVTSAAILSLTGVVAAAKAAFTPASFQAF